MIEEGLAPLEEDPVEGDDLPRLPEDLPEVPAVIVPVCRGLPQTKQWSHSRVHWYVRRRCRPVSLRRKLPSAS